jgi:apolipoprotein N-acyltransferase
MASSHATAIEGPPSVATTGARQWWVPLVLAGGGGLLVFLADYPVEVPWLQLVAFVPLLVGCVRAASWRRAAWLGGAFGLARFLPLGVMLGGLDLPLLPAIGLSLYLVALDAWFAASVFAMRRWPTVAFAVGVGASFAVIEHIDAILPMWGTARSLARSWAIAPEVVGGLLRLGGPALVAFVIVAAQAAVVGALGRRWWPALAVLGSLLAVTAGASLLGPPTSSGRSLRVGAVAWPRRGGETEAERLVAEAAADGARLVVLPEAAFTVGPGEREGFIARWGEVAHRHRIHLVVGFIDRDAPGNRLVVLGPDGALVGQYTKTHMIPVSETLPPGDGELLVFEVDGVRVGTMICQDDNFRDLSEAYVRRDVGIVVVPTNEGPPAVAPYHYRNARLRTIELPLTLVRAAARGTSAVVAAGGEVIAAVDHPREGAGIVVADAPY